MTEINDKMSDTKFHLSLNTRTDSRWNGYNDFNRLSSGQDCNV
jgi:hypothetical protein